MHILLVCLGRGVCADTFFIMFSLASGLSSSLSLTQAAGVVILFKKSTNLQPNWMTVAVLPSPGTMNVPDIFLM